jgi:hypothetical protein
LIVLGMFVAEHHVIVHLMPDNHPIIEPVSGLISAFQVLGMHYNGFENVSNT